MSKWLKTHLFSTWIVCSAVFAFGVHCLFSIPACNEWFAAKWTAGEILTYVSTVALSLLAVWQNKRYKEENDLSQARLEKVAVQANELVVIGKIIEYESSNLSRLRNAYDDFSIACDPQNLSSIISKGALLSGSEVSLLAEIVIAEKHIDDSFFSLCRELRIDPTVLNDDKDPTKISAGKYYLQAKQFVESARNLPNKAPTQELKSLTEARNDFIWIREKYLRNRENILNRAIYDNLTLSEIKQLYHIEISKEGCANGQNEI